MTLPNPSLSIIVVSFNTKDITERCIHSIYNSFKTSNLNFEIVVVDNASTDGSRKMLKEYQVPKHGYILIENENNVGFAKANNQAARIAKGEYLLFLNSDIVVLGNAIEDLFAFYKTECTGSDFAGGKLLNKDNTDQPSCGPFYTLPVIFGALFLKGDHWNLTRYSPNATRQVDWVSGACILTTKRAFQSLHGFDEQIFMYMEEIELLYRAKKKGSRVFFYPKARFIHYGSASSNGKTYPILQVFRGFLYFYRKHRSHLATFLLVCMLKLKCYIAILLGFIRADRYLQKTYAEALRLTSLDRQ